VASSRCLIGLVLLSAAGCIPYSVGTTAAPAPRRDWTRTMTTYFIPGGWEHDNDYDSAATRQRTTLFGWDLDFRYGLSESSDIGIRLPGLMGLVGTYKKRITPDRQRGFNAAYMIGGGFINFFQHAHVEATLLFSAPERQDLVLYGGARVMQVIPVADSAVTDSPTAGFFLGVKIGGPHGRGTISPELGVFYDRSALGIRSRRIVFVPSINFSGRNILRGIFGDGP